jgi:hypothetical protein
VVTVGSALAWDLARAWTRLLDDTLRAFPSPAQRLTSRDPGYWVTETGREVVALDSLLQGKVQPRLSANRNTELPIHNFLKKSVWNLFLGAIRSS